MKQNLSTVKKLKIRVNYPDTNILSTFLISLFPPSPLDLGGIEPPSLPAGRQVRNPPR